MDVKKYFAGVFVLDNKINKLCEKIETLRAAQTSRGGFGTDMGVQKSRNYRRQEDISVSILELEGELAKTKISLLGLEKEIKAASGVLQSPLARAIITWRYICRLKWKDIAARTQMSEMQIIREHNGAIAQMKFESYVAG
jgi:hypothetical protein